MSALLAAPSAVADADADAPEDAVFAADAIAPAAPFWGARS
ncbi:hypothetical protein [Streptomyces sp. NPDC059928]